MKRTNKTQVTPHQNKKRRKSPSEQSEMESRTSGLLDQVAMGSNDIGQSASPVYPTIIVDGAESTQESLGSAEETPEPASINQVSEKAQESPSLRQESPEPLDGPRGPQGPAGDSFIQSRVIYNLRVAFEGSRDSKLVEGLSVLLHKPESYQEIEKETEKHAYALYAESIGTKKLKFSYGNCTIISQNRTKTRLPLRFQDDWTKLYKAMLEYWASSTNDRLHLCISRRYMICQDTPGKEKSFAEVKCLEIDDLMKRTWEKKDYIPHHVLETVISDQAVHWIIEENLPESVPRVDQDAFIHRVQAEGRILLAMCVHVDLGMECLKKLMDGGWKDSGPPLEEKSRCHWDCRRKFKELVQKQGGYRAARFAEGEHKTLHSRTVVPLHFCSRAHGNNDLDREVTEVFSSESQNTSSEESAIKDAAWCGSGGYSNVYCVKMDPNHHSLSSDLDACFALKEFRDKPKVSIEKFHRELAILKELRKYSHDHIVTHLATWTQDERYYMLFPYAQCNLREYMKQNKFDPKNALWLLAQFHGMAEAVKRIHELSSEQAPNSNLSLMTPAAAERRTAWHHDLKPENILFFRNSSSGRGMFRISDWGSGKVNTYRNRSYHTDSPIGTLTYEPPEYTYDGKTSRPYDIWSLGCVFLELLIWAVFGSTIAETFSDQRNDKRNADSGSDNMRDDAFWQKVGNEYVLRDIVVTQLGRLEEALVQPNAPPFKEVVGYIRRMLKIKTRERIKALELCGLLDTTNFMKAIEVESPRDEFDSAARMSLFLTDHHSPDGMALGNSPSSRSSAPAYAELFALSPSDMSPQASRHSRNSSASELMPSGNTRSRQPSNASILSVRERRGSHSSANSPTATKGGT